MIEDQVAPKRCGHTKGKLVVDRAEAFNRIKAAVDAKEAGADIMILARTDARHGHGLEEAIDRAKGFSDLGADMLFVEAPQSEAEMARLTREAPGIHMANLVEGGATPILHPDKLHELGYRFAAYPLTLMSAAMKAIQDALAVMARREHPADALLEFADLRKAVGFDAYYEAEQAYSDSRD
jgi:2-methylisocitrate lyase-like PEP mutase family enzyme